MDNLNSHHENQVAAMIHAAGHRVVFHAPYYAVDCPIEYVFNTLQGMLTVAIYQIKNENDLVLQIQRFIQFMQSFAPYFIHWWFWRN